MVDREEEKNATYNYRLRTEHYQISYRYHYGIRSKWSQVFLFIILFFMVFATINMVIQKEPLPWIILMIFAVYFSGKFVYNLFIGRNWIQKYFRDMGREYIDVTLSFDEEGLKLETEDGHSDLKWKRLHKGYAQGSLLLLYINRGYYHIIDLSQLPEAMSLKLLKHAEREVEGKYKRAELIDERSQKSDF